MQNREQELKELSAQITRKTKRSGFYSIIISVSVIIISTLWLGFVILKVQTLNKEVEEAEKRIGQLSLLRDQLNASISYIDSLNKSNNLQDNPQDPSIADFTTKALVSVDKDYSIEQEFTPTIEIKNKLNILLNKRWKEQVADIFNSKLANYYPFNKNGTDASLQDFEQFFRPESGKFWRFFNDELSPYLVKRGNTWINQDAKSVLKISQSAIRFFQRADQISKQFFTDNKMQLQFVLIPRTRIDLIKNFCLTIDGKTDCYRMGMPIPYDYVWPGQGINKGATLLVETNQGRETIFDFAGNWGWLRLLDKAKIQKLSNDYQISWAYSNNSDNAEITYLFRTNKTEVPGIRTLSQFEVPATLN
ncbi:MAG: hypothetical protein D8M58_22275 [Calditrichaeota bacterium]|nr:MAG: hypothetical protein DWQ03_08540 [Calditrichota bacterium]MBL1208141.1 hypothetical protein [Calditrichota bacterium]NOG47979.1 hypothetical protein [Calditrichota bacterium]